VLVMWPGTGSYYTL